MTDIALLLAGLLLAWALVAVDTRRIYWRGCAASERVKVKQLIDAHMAALEGEARAKQDATDLRVIVQRYEDEAHEEAATLNRIRDGVFAKLDALDNLPPWFVVGVEHAPLVLDRTHTDGSLSDTAWMSTVDEMMPRVVDE